MDIQIPIGQVLRHLSNEKRISGPLLADRLGITKQSVYEVFKKRKSMSLEDIEKWAKALESSSQEIIARIKGDIVFTNEPTGNEKSGAVLALIQKMLEEEVREKNEQIRALQEALKESQQALRHAQQVQTVLLGKSPERSDSKVLTNVFTRVYAEPATAVVS